MICSGQEMPNTYIASGAEGSDVTSVELETSCGKCEVRLSRPSLPPWAHQLVILITVIGWSQAEIPLDIACKMPHSIALSVRAAGHDSGARIFIQCFSITTERSSNKRWLSDSGVGTARGGVSLTFAGTYLPK